MSEYKYRITSTGGSSAKYGNCEVCGKHSTEVFSQSESRKYITATGNESYTNHKCHTIFGHESCLVSKQR